MLLTGSRPRLCHLHEHAARGPSLVRASRTDRVAGAGKQERVRASPLQDPSTQDFLKWCAEHGITTSGLDLSAFGPIKLRGLATTEVTNPKEDMVRVPFASALRVIPYERCPIPDFVSPEFYDRQTPEIKMTFLLLRELKLGDDSMYLPYIRALPSDFDSPAGWEPKELAQMQYAYLEDKAAKLGAEWRDVYAEMSRTSPGASVSREEFVWAAQCVQSRLFSGPYTGRSLKSRVTLAGVVGVLAAGYVALGMGTLQQGLNGFISALLFNIIYDIIISNKLKWYAMLPMVDMANHKTGVPSEVSYQYFTDEFTLEVGDVPPAGQQLFIQYGEKTNDQLMLYYGFSEADNPVDTYTFTNLPDLLEAQGVNVEDSRVQMLREAGIKEGFTEALLARNGFQKDTLRAVRVILSDEGTLKGKGVEGVGEKGDAGDEEKLYRVLIGCAEAELKSKATTAEQDGDLLSSRGGETLTSRMRWAVEFRRQKKLLLREGIANMKKRARL